MELPSHPDADHDASDQRAARNVNWGTVVVVAVLTIVFLLIVVLHLTGVVGPGAQ